MLERGQGWEMGFLHPRDVETREGVHPIEPLLKADGRLHLQDGDSVKVAIARAASVFMDRDACVQKACQLIAEAAANDARLLVFPEAFLSGYPRGLRFQSSIGSRGPNGREDWVRYSRSAVRVPDESIQLIAEAVRQAQLYVALGVVERDDAGSHGTLYCTLLDFGPDGRVLGKHRKLKPTGTERLIWGEGDGSTLPAIQTPFGCLGGLICWENYMPLARMHRRSR